jgi:hypothetical protein
MQMRARAGPRESVQLTRFETLSLKPQKSGPLGKPSKRPRPPPSPPLSVQPRLSCTPHMPGPTPAPSLEGELVWEPTHVCLRTLHSPRIPPTSHHSRTPSSIWLVWCADELVPHSTSMGGALSVHCAPLSCPRDPPIIYRWWWLLHNNMSTAGELPRTKRKEFKPHHCLTL